MRYAVALFTLILFVINSPLSAGPGEVRRPVPLRQGVFLVARPELMDPNFVHAVILLVSYGKDGALGLVINRPAGINLEKALPDMEDIKGISIPLYIGGPVDRNNLCALFTSGESLSETLKVFDNIYFTCRKDVIIPLLKKPERDNKVRIYAGFAGWAPGQLESEIDRRVWITVEADPESVFSDEPLSIWPSIFRIREEILI